MAYYIYVYVYGTMLTRRIDRYIDTTIHRCIYVSLYLCIYLLNIYIYAYNIRDTTVSTTRLRSSVGGGSTATRMLTYADVC